jgi:hypothetical protein
MAAARCAHVACRWPEGKVLTCIACWCRCSRLLLQSRYVPAYWPWDKSVVPIDTVRHTELAHIGTWCLIPSRGGVAWQLCCTRCLTVARHSHRAYSAMLSTVTLRCTNTAMAEGKPVNSVLWRKFSLCGDAPSSGKLPP